MRDQLSRLRTIRDLRADQRRRDVVEAQAAVNAASARIAATEAEISQTREAIASVLGVLQMQGSTLTRADIERAQDLAARYEAHGHVLTRRLSEERRARFKHSQDLAIARAALTAAERAIRQLSAVDERLAEEEARKAEIVEELQAETLTKPRWTGGAGEP